MYSMGRKSSPLYRSLLACTISCMLVGCESRTLASGWGAFWANGAGSSATPPPSTPTFVDQKLPPPASAATNSPSPNSLFPPPTAPPPPPRPPPPAAATPPARNTVSANSTGTSGSRLSASITSSSGNGTNRVIVEGDVKEKPVRADPPPKRPAAGARRVHTKSGHMEWLPSNPPRLPAAQHWKYELDTMLGMSYFFYEVNRAGPIPPNTRAPWRGDSMKKTGGGNLDSVQHQGGFFDAGDHNKFQLPTAYSTARLAWLVNLYGNALNQTSFDGQSNLRWALETVKWGSDFMARGVLPDKLLLHIGDILKDHRYRGRSEMYPQVDRNILYCGKGECSDVAANIAATLAHSAVVFRTMHPALSQHYWAQAKVAYTFVGFDTNNFGVSSNTYPLLEKYYKSTAVKSHAFFGAASMFAACSKLACPATETAGYKQQALKISQEQEADGGSKWYWELPGWDNGWWDGALLMMQSGEEGPQGQSSTLYKHFLANFVQRWVNGEAPIKISPLGQRFIMEWGSNRNAAAGAAAALMWADLPESFRSGAQVDAHTARCMAVRQLHYFAGDNDRGSYVVGFGQNPPTHNHHRNSFVAPWEQVEEAKMGFNDTTRYFYDTTNPEGYCLDKKEYTKAWADPSGRCFALANRPNRWQAHGALVAGPKTPTDAGSATRASPSLEGWNDWRSDYQGNEQALDYTAPFAMALSAAMSLPPDFWTTPCTGKLMDLNLTSKAGVTRTPPKYPDSEVYTFADFEAFGFTRSLSPDWVREVPQ